MNQVVYFRRRGLRLLVRGERRDERGEAERAFSGLRAKKKNMGVNVPVIPPATSPLAPRIKNCCVSYVP